MFIYSQRKKRFLYHPYALRVKWRMLTREDPSSLFYTKKAMLIHRTVVVFLTSTYGLFVVLTWWLRRTAITIYVSKSSSHARKHRTCQELVFTRMYLTYIAVEFGALLRCSVLIYQNTVRSDRSIPEHILYRDSCGLFLFSRQDGLYV